MQNLPSPKYNQNQNLFKQLSGALLDPGAGFGDLYVAANNLFNLLSDIAGFEVENQSNRTDIWLPSGRAIGPSWAAMCLQDFMRTRKFLLGLQDGIATCRNRFPGQTIHVLYAGTGPFATLMLPLTTVFSPADVQFTLLEINPSSVSFLQNTLNALQIDAFVRDIIECDAATFDASVCKPFHLVVSETMQKGLKIEPQVPLSINLLADLEPGGLLVPEKIVIHAGLFNPSVSAEGPEKAPVKLLAEVLDLSISGLRAIQPNQTQWKHQFGPFPEVVVQLPQSFDPGYIRFCLFTTIQTFGDHSLQFRESGLTQPHQLLLLDQNIRYEGKQIGLKYSYDPKPGFVFRLVD
ncbi:MAG: hypothetical protein IT270_01170 [Saprospiraceae bacterium]|nr:hypothetical protein [Saprospiraceae bacterium]